MPLFRVWYSFRVVIHAVPFSGQCLVAIGVVGHRGGAGGGGAERRDVQRVVAVGVVEVTRAVAIGIDTESQVAVAVKVVVAGGRLRRVGGGDDLREVAVDVDGPDEILRTPFAECRTFPVVIHPVPLSGPLSGLSPYPVADGGLRKIRRHS